MFLNFRKSAVCTHIFLKGFPNGLAPSLKLKISYFTVQARKRKDAKYDLSVQHVMVRTSFTACPFNRKSEIEREEKREVCVYIGRETESNFAKVEADISGFRAKVENGNRDPLKTLATTSIIP